MKKIYFILLVNCVVATAQTSLITQQNNINYLTIGTNGQTQGNYGFKNYATITTVGTSNFTVPSGVQTVFVEQWSAGGGGSYAGGGASGGYSSFVFDVSGLSTIILFNGAGGIGSFTELGNAQNGIDSFVEVNTRAYFTKGGIGAVTFSPGTSQTATIHPPNTRLKAFNFLPSNPGLGTTKAVGLYNGGRGGNTPLRNSSGGSGGNWHENNINIYAESTPGVYGSGGGGGLHYDDENGVVRYGNMGGNGLTVIWW